MIILIAFPQLGYGFKSNNSHIAKPEEASDEAKHWWRYLSEEKKIEMLIKHKPDLMKMSSLMALAILNNANKNPQMLFDLEFPE